MSRGRTQRRRTLREREKLRDRAHAKPTFLRKLWGTVKPRVSAKRMIEVTITVIGIAGAYVTLLGYWMPRVSVTSMPPLNPKDAFSAPFSVTNQGYLSLRNVIIGCRIRHIRPIWSDEYQDIEFSGVDDSYDRLEPMKSATKKCPFNVTGLPDQDIDIVVHYRPAWYPFSHDESFRFVTRVCEDGTFQWVPRADANP